MSADYESVALPPTLVAYFDTIDPNAAQSFGEANVVGFRCANGSFEQEDALQEIIDDELPRVTEKYISDMEIFVSASPDNGLPSFVEKSYGTFPQHVSSGSELESWLHVAKKYLPGAEGEVMAEVVASINHCFDPQQFEAALADVSAHVTFERASAPWKMRHHAQLLAGTTTRQLCSFATSEETVRRFADSSFLETFGSDFDRNALQRRILELRGEGSSVAYADLVVQAAKKLTADNWARDSRQLSWILRKQPEIAVQLIADQPKIADRVRTLSRIILQHMEPDEMTDDHHAVLATLEAQSIANPDEYYQFVTDHFKKAGYFAPEHLAALKEIIEMSPGKDWAYMVLCAQLPLEEVTTITTRHPESLDNTEVRAICVRRFAAEGQTEKAYELARNTGRRADSRSSLVGPLCNLLAIYDETGDEAACEEAEQRLETARNGEGFFFLYEADAHELHARTYVAAQRHGHTARATAAAEAMEAYYTHESAHVSDQSLRCRLRLELDAQRLDKAEQYAAKLHDLGSESSDEIKRSDCYNGLLHVIDACMQAGATEQAVRIVQTYFATENPHYKLEIATALLKNETPAYMPSLYASHLNAITQVIDPRRM